MNAVISLVLTLLAVGIAIRYVLKKYNATLVFFTLGIILLLILAWLAPGELMGDKTTGNVFLDVFAYIGASTKKQLGGIGANLMIVAGYAAYMTYIGASDKLANALTRPLLKLGSPYLTMAAFYLLGTVLKMVITTHTGLALLFMATVFPVLTRLGISKLSAAAAIVACGSIDWGATDSAVLFAAENVSNMDLVRYFTSYQWVPGTLSVLTVACTMAILFKRQDECAKAEEGEKGGSVQDASAYDFSKSQTLPQFYTLFPALPLLLVIGFTLFTRLKVDIFTAHVVSLVAVLLSETGRHRSAAVMGEHLKEIFKAMGNSFAGIVTLIIAAGYFADGLIKLGGINIVFGYLSKMHGAQFFTLVALSALTYLAVIILGSGNASWFAFGPLIPAIGSNVGLQAYQLAVPMQLSSSLGRALSPVAAAVLSVAGLAGVESGELIKKNIPPLVLGGIVNILSSYVYLVLLG